MVKFVRGISFWSILLALWLPGGLFPAPASGQSWNGSVPENLRRPRRGEAPRYPRDLVIGELGIGKAPEAAYSLGRDLLAALLAGSRDAPVLSKIRRGVVDGIQEKLRSIGPQQYRIGGGREEEDGSVSFLVRFLGREQGISGELYLYPDGEEWIFDDLILEDPVELLKEREYRYDFSPYERFY